MVVSELLLTGAEVSGAEASGEDPPVLSGCVSTAAAASGVAPLCDGELEADGFDSDGALDASGSELASAMAPLTPPPMMTMAAMKRP